MTEQFENPNNGKKYNFIKRLGSGATATVYKVVEDTRGTGGCRFYALKQIKITIDTPIQKIQQEISIMSRISGNCKVLPCIYDSWHNKTHYYVLMDYINGVPLDELHLPAQCQAWRKICHMLVMGLHYIHSYGIFHRDIKPDNIMVTDDFRIYYVDFGLACQAPCEPAGTPAFMPPEFRDIRYYKDNGASFLSDVYMLGVTMFESIFQEEFNKARGFFSSTAEFRQAWSRSRQFLSHNRDAQFLYPWNLIILQMTEYRRIDRPTTELILQELQKNKFYTTTKIRFSNYKTFDIQPDDEQKTV